MFLNLKYVNKNNYKCNQYIKVYKNNYFMLFKIFLHCCNYWLRFRKMITYLYYINSCLLKNLDIKLLKMKIYTSYK